MKAKINEEELRSWGEKLYSYNEEASSNLTEFEDLISSLSDAYECTSSEAIINNVNSDLKKANQCHENMKNLQNYLENVISSTYIE